MKKLHPFSSLALIFSLILLGRFENVMHALCLSGIYWFFSWYLIRERIWKVLNKGLIIPLLIFSLFYILLTSEPPYLFQSGWLRVGRTAIVQAFMMTVRMLTFLVMVLTMIQKSDRTDWMNLMLKFGPQKSGLMFGVAFNLLPVLQSTFEEFYWYLKTNAFGKFEIMRMIVRFPYVLLTYSLVHAEDIYKSAYARGFQHGFPIKRKPLTPDKWNLTLILFLLAVNLSALTLGWDKLPPIAHFTYTP
ncbi:MAG: energy-coupling factor transporter transmembrane component T [Candidatus Wallbacteria bacterium]|nr:energy-coupling factor transporter transmembrane component T [Candidatus Wallbacteria bacterium]